MLQYIRPAHINYAPIVSFFLRCSGGRLGNASTRSDSGRTPMHTGSATPMHGSKTPMYGSQTPMYGSQTPLYDGSRTPHYGSHTPLHEGGASSRTTPGSSSIWDPTSGSTPARYAACAICTMQPAP